MKENCKEQHQGHANQRHTEGTNECAVLAADESVTSACVLLLSQRLVASGTADGGLSSQGRAYHPRDVQGGSP